jgi:hypothetical protein
MKKGSMLDYFWLLIVILFLGISILLATYLKDAIFPQLSNAFSSSPAAQTELTTVSGYFSTFDIIFLFLYIVMSIVPIIFAFLTYSNPVFMLIDIILLIIFILIAPQISNVMKTFWSLPQFSQYSAGGLGSVQYILMTGIFEYLPLISAAFGIVLCVVSFAKGGSGGV